MAFLDSKKAYYALAQGGSFLLAGAFVDLHLSIRTEPSKERHPLAISTDPRPSLLPCQEVGRQQQSELMNGHNR